MELLLLETADPVDAPSLLALRHELEDWLESKGVERWVRGEVSWDDVDRQIAD